MHLRTVWISLPLAIVLAAAMLIAFTATPSVSSAGTILGNDVSQTTAGMAPTLDVLPPGDTADPAPPALPTMNGNDNHWDMDGGWWIVMVAMMVLFWGAIIAVVVWGIRQFTGGRRQDRSALDIAKERLARGEITKEEFDRIRGDLV
jgi:putative membrane protein